MKKKKKPIILVLLLLVFVSIGAVMNLPASQGPEEKDVAAKPEESAKVANDVKDQMAKTKPADKAQAPKKGPGKKGFNIGHRDARGEVPSILKLQYTPQKPKMSDSSTSTQWYTAESARNKPTSGSSGNTPVNTPVKTGS